MGCGGSKSSAAPPALPKATPLRAPLTPSTISAVKKPFAVCYELKQKLGQGQYAVVHMGLNKETHQIVAVKCIRKDKLSKEDLEALTVEVKSMEMLNDHPNFVKYYDFFSEKEYFFIVLELIQGGELFDRICEKQKYTEREARQVMYLLSNALTFMHSKGIVHRDLKPENVLLKTKEDDTSIKLADLGFAKILSNPNQLMTTPCGTPGYVAPEVISGHSYGPACDVWSLGVIFYILLCGYPPFADDNQEQLFNSIKKGHYQMDPAEWGVISDGAKDLVRKILVVDPKQRITAAQILNHPWMKMDVAKLPEISLSGQQAALRRFQARRRLKKAMHAVRSTIRVRMLLAAHAAKKAKAQGKSGDEVHQAFFEAARAAPVARAPPLPPPISAVAPRHLNQSRMAAIVSPQSIGQGVPANAGSPETRQPAYAF